MKANVTYVYTRWVSRSLRMGEFMHSVILTKRLSFDTLNGSHTINIIFVKENQENNKNLKCIVRKNHEREP